VSPWKPATELAPSEAVSGLIEMPTICGKHVIYYPAFLVDEAMRGRFYAFVAECDCPTAYLIETEPDGAHTKGGRHTRRHLCGVPEPGCAGCFP
jgi:hypothetical protein